MFKNYIVNIPIISKIWKVVLMINLTITFTCDYGNVIQFLVLIKIRSDNAKEDFPKFYTHTPVASPKILNAIWRLVIISICGFQDRQSSIEDQ